MQRQFKAAKRFAILAVLLSGLLLPHEVSAAGCQFILGFAALAQAIPQVGACVDNQAFASNGDAIQHTTGGLLVWRRADNWTAFTDGYRTWADGPFGIKERLNTDRFPWEGARTAAGQGGPALDCPGHLTFRCWF